MSALIVFVSRMRGQTWSVGHLVFSCAALLSLPRARELLGPPAPKLATTSAEPCGARDRHGCERDPGYRGARAPSGPGPATTRCSPPAVPPAAAAATSGEQCRLSPGWGGEPRPAGQGRGPNGHRPASGLPDARCRSLPRAGGGLKGLRTALAPTKPGRSCRLSGVERSRVERVALSRA